MARFEIAKDRIITVFGGSGFLGRYVVRSLAQRGWRVRVASRRPDLAFHLQPLGRVGQIHAVQANLRYPASLAAAMRGSDAVVNLVGILAEAGQQNFETVHVSGTRAIARAAKDHGIGALLQVSAIGADAKGASAYARTKAAAEAAAREILPETMVVRPSILFGPEDDFFNRFAALARISPVMPLIGGGTTRFQPAYVGDVAEAIARSLEGAATPGVTYELGGPEILTFEQILRYICAETGRKRAMVSIPAGLASGPAALSEVINGLTLGALPSMFQLTRDQLKLLEQDNVVSAAATTAGHTFAGLGIQPQTVEAITPTYLYRFRKTGQFDRTRQTV
ncbi:complex I NDUFA9 subunit family protein [Lichenihabitans sp. Uapishka_5]|uniref:complex I NDUFA9 subunit family protein n=1 Tax=Lichenihabitans sp. Uapishka_5 TaxID=3037302 RepID=UPI0029E7E45A|nr:complex I NDUFA9 subunit family protein [Lichenihabitans sp. Uapishka_5]MDX7950411.1 complex I NDUFA9 subunit family protein [Lichenihabitans sp. Uapishka_5]